MNTTRTLPFRADWLRRALWPLALAALTVTCDTPTSVRRSVNLSLAPVLSVHGLSDFAGLSVDNVRLTAIRPPSDTLTRQTYDFSPDSSQITANLPVEVIGTEDLLIIMELRSGSTVLFTGQQTITVTPGLNAPVTTPVALTYSGPGATLKTLAIAPRDSGVTFGGQVQFRATATDSSDNPVPQFYTAWRTSGAASTINATGTFTAGTARGTAWVIARTPNGVSDSTRVMVNPAPTHLQIVSGDGQNVAPGAALPQPLVARVLAADNLPVAGAPVTFQVSGGGTPATAQVASDSLGLASVTVTAGSATGSQSVTASVPGATSAQFAFTVTGAVAPALKLTLPGGGLLTIGGQTALKLSLNQPAPAGGLVASVTSDSTQYVTVAAPGTVSFAAGDTAQTILVTGVTTGLSVLHATAPGYAADSAFAIVVPNVIVLQSGVALAAGASDTLHVHLLPAAPQPNPLTVTLASTDTTVLRVTTTTVSIPAGSADGTATIQGVVAGVAGVTATAAGYAPGGAVVTVTSGGGVPATMTKQAGDSLTAYVGDTIAIRPKVLVKDALGQPVAGVAVLFAVAGGGGSVTGATPTTDANGLASVGSWKLGAAPGANTLVVALPAFPLVTPVVFTATGTLPPPNIVLSVFGSNVVGQARSGELDVRLLQAAPAGGLTVSVTSDSTQFLTVGTFGSASGSVSFAAGDTLKSLAVFGDSSRTGTARVRATAPGYTADTLFVPVSQNLISLPATLNVPVSQSVSLPVQISSAAPVGGLTIAVTSNNPALVSVTTPTVTVPQGQTLVNATLQGVALGSTTVTATNPNYAPFMSTVSVTATLDITQSSINLNASFGTPFTVQLESGGTPISAPAGGVAVTLSSGNAACATASNASIGAGFVNTSVPVTYGGSATLPCSTYLYVNGPAGFTGDSVLASVAVQPSAPVSAVTIGAGLQRFQQNALGATNHGGTTVRITSANPSLFLVARDDSTPGSAFVDIPVLPNQTLYSYYVQALDGTTADSALITAAAPGFVTGSAQVRVFTAVYDIIFFNTTANSRAADNLFEVRTGSPTSPTSGISTEDARRAGGTPLVATVINDAASVGTLHSGATTGDTVTTSIVARQSRSPTTVAAGGVSFDYTAGGVAHVTASIPGLRALPTDTQIVTVSAPVVTPSTNTVGAGLQRQSFVSLSAAAQAGDTLTLVTSRPGVVMLSPTDTGVGRDTLVAALTPGSSTFYYYVQGVDSILADSVTITASVPGFTSAAPANTRVFQPVADIIFFNTTATSRSADNLFEIRIGTPSSPTSGISTEDAIRAHGATRTVSVVNDSTAVGTLVTSALIADSVTTTLAAGQSRSPSTVATGGVAFRYLGGGTASVRASIPGFRMLPTATQTVVVSAPTVTVNAVNVGAGLQRQTAVSLGAAAVAGDTLTITPSKTGVLLLSPTDSTVGTDTLRVALTPGTQTYYYYAQGLDSIAADSVNLTASIPTFTSGAAAKARVFTAVYDIIFLNPTANSLASNNAFQVRTGSPSLLNGGISTEDPIRAGDSTRTVTLTSSASTVAQLVTQGRTGDTVTVAITPRNSRTPATVATGGVELDYLTTGSTVVRASIPGFRAITTSLGDTVTVTAPTISVNAATVGSGLQVASNAFLSASQHGGVDVVIKSLNPAVALISPDAVTPGSDSIVEHLNNGSSTVSYYVQGVEGQTGAVTIKVQAPGFVDGSATITVVQPSVDVIFLASSGSATTTADNVFEVRTGWSGAPNTSMSQEEAVRAGAPGPLTVTISSANPAAGLLKTLTSSPSGDSAVTVQIAAGQARSPATVAAGGVAFDFVGQGITYVLPVITGYISVPPTGFQVNVGP